MSFLGRLLSSKSPPRAADPDEPVELALVSGPSGPMTVARLRADGFDAGGYEVAIWKGVGHYRILVPRHQLASASEVLDSFR